MTRAAPVCGSSASPRRSPNRSASQTNPREVPLLLRRFRSHFRHNVVALALMAMLAWLVAAPAATADDQGNSAAVISGEFGDSCTNFEAHSTKDISYVEIHYADGRVVKDETIDSPDYAIDGGTGDEIDSASVKSGTTTEQFECVGDNPPVAILEVKTPPDCVLVVPEIDSWACGDAESPRTTWLGVGQVGFGCFFALPCNSTVEFRGTSSSDPDGDITSWSIDFGDGTSASGDWATEPPADVAHTLSTIASNVVTLTVIDSAGQSDSDTLLVFFDHED